MSAQAHYQNMVAACSTIVLSWQACCDSCFKESYGNNRRLCNTDCVFGTGSSVCVSLIKSLYS